MAATSIILQNSLFTTILLPFLLIFFIVWAILEKTKVFGEKLQINAFISFIIGLIVVAAFNYSGVINNLVLFLTIGLVIVFVALLLWGFVSGESGFNFGNSKVLRTIFFITLILAVLLGVFWAFGIPLSNVTNFLFNQVWSQPFWTNLIFIVIVGVLLAIVLRMGSGGKK